MTGFTVLLLLSSLFGQELEPRPEQPRLTRTVDGRAYLRCMGGLVGFSNVPMECSVSEDGTLRQCELKTQNRNIQIYKRRFECMASTITVTRADGSSAAGERVGIRLNAGTPFYDPR